MLIKCPRCATSAKLDDSKEGAKVRCASCERIYVARPIGQRGQRTQTGLPAPAIIGAALALVALILFVLVKRADKGQTEVSEVQTPPLLAKPAEAAPIDPYSFEGEVTQFCILMHTLALESDRGLLRFHMSGDHILASEKEGVSSQDLPFSSLAKINQQAHLERWAEDLTTGPSSEYVKDWKPYDTDVTQLDQASANIKLSVASRDASDARQHEVIWDLARVAGAWKIAGWKQFKKPSGKRTESYAVSAAGLTRVVQPDGHVVVEREPEALEHMQDSSPELRARIDALYRTMIDLDLTRESNRARDELISIGKPAVPILLTGLYETRLDTEQESIRANIIVVALRKITGTSFGYTPMALASKTNTEEYRMSAVRQWFAWWYRFGPKFMEKLPSEDALDEYIELTDKEKRALERDKKRNP